MLVLGTTTPVTPLPLNVIAVTPNMLNPVTVVLITVPGEPDPTVNPSIVGGVSAKTVKAFSTGEVVVPAPVVTVTVRPLSAASGVIVTTTGIDVEVPPGAIV